MQILTSQHDPVPSCSGNLENFSQLETVHQETSDQIKQLHESLLIYLQADVGKLLN